MSEIKKISDIKSFGGRQIRFSHESAACACTMTASIYLPPQAEQGQVPVLWWLSGLTCTDENFVQKAGAQQYASAHGIAVIAPDTSPRGEGVPDDAEGAWDFGLAAGFYVNATQAPFDRNYHMYDYIVTELPGVVSAHFPLDMGRQAISGHSMGGHGALTLALRNPDRFRSVSAFAPIVAPSQVPWGQKAFSGYLGDDREIWKRHDACALIKSDIKERLAILVDTGDADPFLERELRPQLLQEACAAAEHPLKLRMQPGYDHSYFFIATFMADHMSWHAGALKA